MSSSDDPYMPTPEEIEAMTKKIRKEWEESGKGKTPKKTAPIVHKANLKSR